MSLKQKANKRSFKKGGTRSSVAGKCRSDSDAPADELAERILIVGEEARDFREFAVKTIDQLKPVGHLEQTLSEDIAITWWRLKRIPGFEAAVLSARDATTAPHSPANEQKSRRDHLAEMASRYLQGDQKSSREECVARSAAQKEADKNGETVDSAEAIGRALVHDGQNGDALGKILRTERSLINTLAHLMRLLSKLQSARNELEQAAKPAKPAAVDESD